MDKEAELLTRNPKETIEFINNNEDELVFIYMSEAMKNVVLKEKNDIILSAYEKSIERFPDIISKFNIRKWLTYVRSLI